MKSQVVGKVVLENARDKIGSGSFYSYNFTVNLMTNHMATRFQLIAIDADPYMATSPNQSVDLKIN